MHGALAARAALVAGALLVIAFPAAADPVPECVDVFLQPQEQPGTEVTPVATGSQFGLVVMVDATDDAGLFASAQARPMDCPSQVPPRPPQSSADRGALEEPVSVDVPARAWLESVDTLLP